MEKIKVLCLYTQFRAQPDGGGFFEHAGRDRFIAESAGIEPGKLNPVVVEAMRDAGIDISQNKTKGVFDLYKQGKLYNYVITVCDAEAGERCPLFPGKVTRLHWEFNDPSKFQGTPEEKLAQTIVVREQIRSKIQEFIQTIVVRLN